MRLTLFELPNWRPVSAVVVDSRLEESVESGTRMGQPGSPSKYVYRPKITYKYSFDGREYVSDTFRLLAVSGDNQRTQQAIVDSYPVGRQTTAYVNPANPGEAVLDRKEMETPVTLAALGGFFALAGTGILIGAVVFTVRASKVP